jgi:hypothetical protein
VETNTPMQIEETYSMPLKRTILHSGGAQNIVKDHEEVPQYTITKDDTDLVMKSV